MKKIMIVGSFKDEFDGVRNNNQVFVSFKDLIVLQPKNNTSIINKIGSKNK